MGVSASWIAGRCGSERVRALEELHHPHIRPDAVVGALSIAAQQIVEIARAVAVGCRVLVLDEPTSSLAQADVEALFELVARLRQQGQAVIYITHFIEEVQRVADRFTVLRDGQTVGGGEMAATTVRGDRRSDGRPARRAALPAQRARRGEPLLEVTELAGVANPSAPASPFTAARCWASPG